MRLLLYLLGASADAVYQEGVARFGRGEPLEASTLFRRAVELEPAHARAWKALGAALSLMNQFEAAADPFEKACLLDATLEDACYYLARNLYARNRFDESLRAIEKAARIDRKPGRIANARGQALEALGRNAEAEAEYKTSIRQAANAIPRPEEDARLSFGIFLVRQGDAAAASRWLSKAAAAHPKSAKAQFELGRAQYQMGRLEESRASLGAALAADPGFEAARLLLAKVANRLAAR